MCKQAPSGRPVAELGGLRRAPLAPDIDEQGVSLLDIGGIERHPLAQELPVQRRQLGLDAPGFAAGDGIAVHGDGNARQLVAVALSPEHEFEAIFAICGNREREAHRHSGAAVEPIRAFVEVGAVAGVALRKVGEVFELHAEGELAACVL